MALINDQRTGARIVSDILLELQTMTVPGVSLAMLEELTARRITEAGAVSTLLGYHPEWSKTAFPGVLTASINEEVCHAPAGDRLLINGDIITYDLALKYGEGCADAALTVPVGEISNRKARLMRYAREALDKGVEAVFPQRPVTAIGSSIERHAERNGYSVIKDFGGHLIGAEMHMKPHIRHFYHPDDHTTVLEEGQVVCLEPMLTSGRGRVMMEPDGWTATTIDRQPVAYFEHMVLVTKDAREILTTWHL